MQRPGASKILWLQLNLSHKLPGIIPDWKTTIQSFLRHNPLQPEQNHCGCPSRMGWGETIRPPFRFSSPTTSPNSYVDLTGRSPARPRTLDQRIELSRTLAIIYVLRVAHDPKRFPLHPIDTRILALVLRDRSIPWREGPAVNRRLPFKTCTLFTKGCSP